MNASEVIKIAEVNLGNHFPELVVKLFPDPDDEKAFIAYMFCVPDGTEKDTRVRARDFICNDLKELGGWDIFPLIKNLSATQKHYPQYVKQQSHSKDTVSDNDYDSDTNNPSSICSFISVPDVVHNSHYHCRKVKPISKEAHENRPNLGFAA